MRIKMMKEIKNQKRIKAKKRNKVCKAMVIAMKIDHRYYRYFMKKAKKINFKDTNNIANLENNLTFILNPIMKN